MRVTKQERKLELKRQGPPKVKPKPHPLDRRRRVRHFLAQHRAAAIKAVLRTRLAEAESWPNGSGAVWLAHGNAMIETALAQAAEAHRPSEATPGFAQLRVREVELALLLVDAIASMEDA